MYRCIARGHLLQFVAHRRVRGVVREIARLERVRLVVEERLVDEEHEPRHANAWALGSQIRRVRVARRPDVDLRAVADEATRQRTGQLVVWPYSAQEHV